MGNSTRATKPTSHAQASRSTAGTEPSHKLVMQVGEAALRISNLSKSGFEPDTLANLVRDTVGVHMTPEQITGVVVLVKACTGRNGGAARTKPVNKPLHDGLLDEQRRARANDTTSAD